MPSFFFTAFSTSAPPYSPPHNLPSRSPSPAPHDPAVHAYSHLYALTDSVNNEWADYADTLDEERNARARRAAELRAVIAGRGRQQQQGVGKKVKAIMGPGQTHEDDTGLNVVWPDESASRQVHESIVPSQVNDSVQPPPPPGTSAPSASKPPVQPVSVVSEHIPQSSSQAAKPFVSIGTKELPPTALSADPKPIPQTPSITRPRYPSVEFLPSFEPKEPQPDKAVPQPSSLITLSRPNPDSTPLPTVKQELPETPSLSIVDLARNPPKLEDEEERLRAVLREKKRFKCVSTVSAPSASQELKSTSLPQATAVEPLPHASAVPRPTSAPSASVPAESVPQALLAEPLAKTDPVPFSLAIPVKPSSGPAPPSRLAAFFGTPTKPPPVSAVPVSAQKPPSGVPATSVLKAMIRPAAPGAVHVRRDAPPPVAGKPIADVLAATGDNRIPHVPPMPAQKAARKHGAAAPAPRVNGVAVMSLPTRAHSRSRSAERNRRSRSRSVVPPAVPDIGTYTGKRMREGSVHAEEPPTKRQRSPPMSAIHENEDMDIEQDDYDSPRVPEKAGTTVGVSGSGPASVPSTSSGPPVEDARRRGSAQPSKANQGRSFTGPARGRGGRSMRGRNAYRPAFNTQITSPRRSRSRSRSTEYRRRSPSPHYNRGRSPSRSRSWSRSHSRTRSSYSYHRSRSPHRRRSPSHGRYSRSRSRSTSPRRNDSYGSRRSPPRLLRRMER